MTLSVLDVQHALRARGVDRVRWYSIGDRTVLYAWRLREGDRFDASHAQPDEAWRRLFAAIDASVEPPRMDVPEMVGADPVPVDMERAARAVGSER